MCEGRARGASPPPPPLPVPRQMLRSVFCSIFGGLGAFYCLVVSSTALADGPLCETAPQKWDSPFKNRK